MNRLGQNFYEQDAITVAKALVGKLLVRKLMTGEILKYRITETEVYYGEEDTACHASKGKTARTAIMYEEGGYAYVYLCYGIHSLLNVVTGPKDHPEAVLIRGIEGYVGPGKLTKVMGIGLALNKENLITSDQLWLEDDGFTAKLKADKRVGIGYASSADQNKKWRFIIK